VTQPAAVLPEAELNRRLRRVDWRFLLPTVRPRRTLCLATGPLAEGVALISGEVLTRAEPGTCDLAVVEHPDDRRLAAVVTALRPGGACYVEWPRSRVGPRSRGAALKRAGLAEVASYRPWPAGPSAPRYWIPLGAKGAAAYVRSREPLEGGLLRKARAAGSRVLRDAARRLGSAPVCTIGLRPPLGPEAPCAWLQAAWSAWRLGTPPERISRLLVTGGPRSVSKVVTLVFPEPAAEPRLAIKGARVPASFAPLAREAAVLTSLETGLGSTLPAGVPRLLFQQEIDGVPVIGETAVCGQPLEHVLSSSTLHRWATAAAEWLVPLVTGPTQPAAFTWRSLVQPVLNVFGESFGRVVDARMLSAAEAVLRELGDLPATCEQRDFAPWNIFVMEDGQLAVLDWESATVDGLPALDLLYFLAYATFNAAGAISVADRVAAYRGSLDPGTPAGGVRQRTLARYAARVGLPTDALRKLAVLVWLIHAGSEFQHFTDDVGGAPSSEALRQSLFLALWQEEMRHVAGG
jgi:hypothetical protein